MIDQSISGGSTIQLTNLSNKQAAGIFLVRNAKAGNDFLRRQELVGVAKAAMEEPAATTIAGAGAGAGRGGQEV